MKVPILVTSTVPDANVGIFAVNKKGKITKIIAICRTKAMSKPFEIEGVTILPQENYIFAQYDYRKPRNIMVRIRKVGFVPFEVTKEITEKGLMVLSNLSKDYNYLE